MSTDSSQKIEDDPWELFEAFILAFWPVALCLGLIEFLFYDGPGSIPINLAVASLAGMLAVKRHQSATERRTDPRDTAA